MTEEQNKNVDGDELADGSEERTEETTTAEPSTISQFSIPISIVIAGVIVGLAIMISNGGGTTAAVPTPSGEGNQQAAGNPSAVDIDDDPMLGDVDAPVTIIEFSDYQCPFCRRFWQETLPFIKESYIETGKVRFVYRDFPLTSIHPEAQLAAEAAECAGDQGFYWQAHDVIFEEQSLLGQGTVRFSQDDIERWFSRIAGLDVDAVAACIASGEKREEIANDLADGRAGGVTGTPGFIVNGRLVTGALPITAFEEVIESALGQ